MYSNTEIIQLIAVIFPPVFTLLSTIVIFRHNIQAPSKRKIYAKQLFKVFAPLHKILNDLSNTANDAEETKKALMRIEKIINYNYVLIPSNLHTEYSKLVFNFENNKTETDIRFSAFACITFANYNILRKILGYPYRRITSIYLEEPLKSIAKNSIYLKSILPAVPFLIAWMTFLLFHIPKEYILTFESSYYGITIMYLIIFIYFFIRLIKNR